MSLFPKFAATLALTFGLSLLSVAWVEPGYAQKLDGRAPAVNHSSFTPKQFDNTLSGHVEDVAKNVSQSDLSKGDIDALKEIYRIALDTRHTRLAFLNSVNSYETLVKSNAGLLDREQAYYEMGTKAASLLDAVNALDSQMQKYATEVDLHFRPVGLEIGQYENQKGNVLHPLLDKPKLTGMKADDFIDLQRQLTENGKHLDAAIDGLHDAILRSYPRATIDSTK